MTNLIFLYGETASGKTTVAHLLLQHLPHQHKTVAAPLKAHIAKLTGCKATDLDNQAFKASFAPQRASTGKPYTYRQLMQLLSDDLKQESGQSVFIDKLFDTYAPGDNWLISDGRYPIEADAARSRGGMVIRIVRPVSWWRRILNYLRNPRPHSSETAMRDYRADYTLINDGTLADLQAKANALASQLAA